MLVQPISYNISNNVSKNQNVIKNKTHNNITNSITFGNFPESINCAVKKTFTKDTEVEKVFNNLLEDLLTDYNTKRKADFFAIYDIYKEKGFNGLFHELWKSNPDKRIATILNNPDNEYTILAARNDSPALELINFGNTSFIDSYAPKDIRLSFTNNKKFIEFHLDKKQNLILCQTENGTNITTSFYASTGTPKYRKIQESSGTCNTAYYNKDGSMPFWKNFIFGGTIVPIW